MNIEIRWHAGQEYENKLLFRKWRFTTSDFNGEIPRVGDKLYLSLPAINDPILRSEIKLWRFQIIERTWQPEKHQKLISLSVELDDRQSFSRLPDEVKADLKEKLEKEEDERRKEEFEQQFKDS